MCVCIHVLYTSWSLYTFFPPLSMSLLFSALADSFLSGQSQMNDEAGESKGRIYSISKNEEKKNTLYRKTALHLWPFWIGGPLLSNAVVYSCWYNDDGWQSFLNFFLQPPPCPHIDTHPSTRIKPVPKRRERRRRKKVIKKRVGKRAATMKKKQEMDTAAAAASWNISQKRRVERSPSNDLWWMTSFFFISQK